MRVSADATARPTTARATWLLVLAAVAVAVVLALVPVLRSPGAAVTAWAGAVAAAAGVARHRPVPPLPWVLLAVMLVLWSTATTAVQLEGRVSTPTAALVGAGQVLAVVVTGWVLVGARTGTGARRRTGHRSPDEALVDGVIIATVLGLVTAQVVAVAVSSARSATTVLVPVVDVAVLGMLLRFLVSHRLIPVAGRLVLAAAVVTVAHDLSAAVHGDRLPLPGEPAQVLGAVCALLFGAAALHPSMVDVFAADGATRRAPSSALLGLLPLVAVPLGLWWVGSATDVRGLPTPVLLAGASAVAALCLVRASGALRGRCGAASTWPSTTR